ncbi:DUF5063 domain-containing protein [Tuwongella immobilis]|uniref:DUF5063 domain-containing protein n=1 Tax=Tuwongella immobilis TaxID=692036 RepID=A0A6C2YK17_9BACT|nr:DUF5063 domain-containing protein [Tuwongella immobilis]VIP01766.1 Uncharacterized protein OS=Bacillus cibi GN=GS18_0210365 PE=4 SV=1 [Tuwongella immobilis]VTR99385.1 Uncharacterized protein OS=Bacillus cibi GN=GS18_0210365 PE=4 SV=1 [Tuwongella immobilis]
MDAVERFAAEAVAYREWAARGTDTGEYASRTALLRITRLYLAALELPPAWSEELADQPDAQRVGNEEWRAVFAAAGRLPLDSYGAVFDPSVVPLEEPVVGSLSDDIADIYRDVVSGLWAFEAGRQAAAVWAWGFGFRHHWGEHATGAIRALHSWLAANAFDRLASDAEPSAAADGGA